MRKKIEGKKKEELEILELFRKLYADFPKAALIPDESPDFVLRIGPKKKIGVEITRLSQKSPESDPFSYNNISACLLSKEQKLLLYRRKKLLEYWLILTVQDPSHIPRYSLHNKLLTWIFNSGFNRVFLLYLAKNKIYELKTEGGSYT